MKKNNAYTRFYQILPLFYIFLLCISCKNNPENQHKKLQVEILDTTAFKYFEPFINKKNLDQINKGYDSLQLRIWYAISFSDSVDLFILTHEKNSQWSARWERFLSRFESENIPQVIQFEDGQKIWEQLQKTGVMEYSGMTKDELDRYSDGEIVVIEIAMPGFYRRVCSQASLAYHSKYDTAAVKKANEVLQVFWDATRFGK